MLKTEPRVAIVILNWNSFEVTLDCLVSLRKMEYRNYEVVLVDNGSVDSSPDKLAESPPEETVIRNSGNPGFTGRDHCGPRSPPPPPPPSPLPSHNTTN